MNITNKELKMSHDYIATVSYEMYKHRDEHLSFSFPTYNLETECDSLVSKLI